MQKRHTMFFFTALFALSGVLVGCKAQEAKPHAVATPPTSTIATPVETNNGAPLVSGLPDFTRLVDFVSPAVVNIRVNQKVAQSDSSIDLRNHPICQIWPDIPICSGKTTPKTDPDAPKERLAGQGSGFITSADGYILTNYHVVNGASSLTVVLPDKREFKARVIGADQRTDVAVIKIDASGLPFLKMANSDKLKVGEWVMAAGSPFGLRNTITTGVVSAINRDTGDYLNFIQTDAAVNPGNSGGPLVNMSGEVVGITSQILSPSGGFSGIALAIPINDALHIAEQLRASGKVEHGRIGVGIEPVTDDNMAKFGLSQPKGVLINQVEAGSPAAKAGLQRGDVVTAINGTVVDSVGDFARAIGESHPGVQVQMDVWRDQHSTRLNAIIGEAKQ